MRWFPVRAGVSGAHLKKNCVLRTVVVQGHANHGLEQCALVVDAQESKASHAFEQLVENLIDARTSFARTGDSRDEPALTERMPVPSHAGQLEDDEPPPAQKPKKQPQRHRRQKSEDQTPRAL